MEFDYIIHSVIDLQSLTIYLQLNNEKIKDLDFVSLSGERISNIRQIRNGAVLFDVKDINKDSDTVIRVVYNIEDVSDYINEKIALFNSQNLSNDNKILLEEAKNNIAKNDSENALKKIVEIERNIEKENIKEQKAEAKYQKLVGELNNELRKLQRSLENAKNKGLETEITDSIEARINLINESLDNYKTPSDESIEKLSQLEKSYEKNLVGELRKKLVGEFNGLKERLYKIGIIEMPSSFKDVEDALVAARDTGDLRYIIEAAEKLRIAKAEVEEKEKEKKNKTNGLGLRFADLKQKLKKNVDVYKKQAADAKSTKYAYLFEIDAKNIEKIVKDTEKTFEKGNTDEINDNLEKMAAEAENIELTIENLEIEARGKLANLENMFRAASLGGDDKTKISKKLERMKELIGNGDYVNALKAGDVILDDLKKASGGGDNSIIILGATALFVVAALVIYMFKFSGKKEKTKELRKLKKVNE